MNEFEMGLDKPILLRFLVPGAHYRVLGIIPCHWHLFGTDGERLFLLGTDGYGRDLLSRILCGGQTSLLAGFLGMLLTLLGALCVGAVAGFYGGWRDALLMRTSELFMALPWMYFLLAIRALLPLNVSPLEAFLLIVSILGVTAWAKPARLVRALVLSAKKREFVYAARGFGASDGYLLARHVLPTTYNVLLTQAGLLIPQFVLAEVTLSFLGLGVPEPLPSWGNLLANLQRYDVLVSYWWMYLPALAMIPFFFGYLGIASAMQASGTEFGKVIDGGSYVQHSQ